MKRIAKLFLILLPYIILAQTPDLNAIFDKANANYRNNAYTEALKGYHRIDSLGFVSADLYFNMGNAYYKLNQVAPSIYYYEKALLVDPQYKDAQQNLIFAQRSTIDAIEEVPKTLLQKFNKTVTYAFSYNTWAWITVVLAFLTSLFFLMYHFAKRASRKQLFFILSFGGIALFLLTLFFTIKARYHFVHDKPAIVFSSKVSVKTAPQISAEETFILHEGTKVQVLDSIDNWCKIQLADGKIGWLVKEDVKLLK